MTSCIICSCELTDENWVKNQRKNWINKCKSCLTIEKCEYAKVWRARNPGASSTVQLRHRDKLRKDDPIRARARSAYADCRKRAIRSGMDFNLTPSKVTELMRAASVCPYFGTPLTFAQGDKDETLASIDRIDSSKGYTEDNVQIISYLANLMKSHATPKQLLMFANGVISMLGVAAQ